jgi:signal transduction histidine kinase
MCRITVTDEGQGIPLEEQANVFERFYRVQRGMVRRVEQDWGLPLRADSWKPLTVR